MGLFSRKKVISVASQTFNLSGDKEQTNFLRKTINSAVMAGTDISATMQNSYLNGMGIKIDQTYRYARDYSPTGLPEGRIGYGTLNQEDLMDVLSSLNSGKQVALVMSDFGTVDLGYWTEDYLTKTYDWDEDHGGFGNPPSGVPTNANYQYSIDNNGVVTIEYLDGETVVHTETVSFPDVNLTGDYYQVIYRVREAGTPTTTVEERDYQIGDVDDEVTTHDVNNNFGEYTYTTTTVKTEVDILALKTTITTTVTVDTLSRKQYFMYEAGTGTYPILDDILDDDVASSDYYPIVPLRVYNKDWTNPANVPADEFKANKNILRRIGVSLTELGDKLNENPDVGDIDHAFFVLGISLNSKYPSSISYLHEYFKFLAKHSPSQKKAYLTWYNDNVVTINGVTGKNSPKPPVNKLKIKQKPYDVTISYQYASYIVKTGVIGKKGTITRELGTAAAITIINEFDQSTELTADVSVIYFRKQISATQYEEIELCGLEHINNVYKGHNVSTSAKKSLESRDGNEAFLIPLCRSVVLDMSLVDRTQMTFDCLHLVANSYQEKKLKWYQSGWFKVVVIVIAIVVSVISLGSLASGAAAAASAATAAGTSVAAAVAIYLGTQIAIGVVVAVAVQQVIRRVAPEIGVIIAVVALAYGVSSQAGAGGTKGLPYASEVLQLVPAVTKGVNQRLQSDLQAVMKEMRVQQELYEDRMEQIKDAMNALNGNQDISIEDLTRGGYLNLFETAQSFFNRTLLQNPGPLTLNTIQDFVTTLLALPDDLTNVPAMPFNR